MGHAPAKRVRGHACTHAASKRPVLCMTPGQQHGMRAPQDGAVACGMAWGARRMAGEAHAPCTSLLEGKRRRRQAAPGAGASRGCAGGATRAKPGWAAAVPTPPRSRMAAPAARWAARSVACPAAPALPAAPPGMPAASPGMPACMRARPGIPVRHCTSLAAAVPTRACQSGGPPARPCAQAVPRARAVLRHLGCMRG